MEKIFIWVGKVAIAFIVTEAIVGVVNTTVKVGRMIYDNHLRAKIQREQAPLQQKALESIK